MLAFAALPDSAHALDARVSDLLLRYAAEGPHEATLFVPTPAALSALQQAVDEANAACRAAGAVPHALTDYFAACLIGLRTNLAADPARPAAYVQRLASALPRLVTEDPRPHVALAPILRAKLDAAPDLIAAVRTLCRTLPDDRLTATAEALDSLARVLDACRKTVALWFDAPGLATLCEGASLAATAARAVLLADIGTPRDDDGDAPEMAYADLLMGRFGIALADLLTWHEAEIARVADELMHAAAAVAPGVPAPRLLMERSGPYDSPDAMFAAAHACLALAHDRARAFVNLPEGEECRIEPMPQLLEGSYPWGGAHGFPPVQGQKVGVWYLNTANWRAVTRGWVQMMAIHEVYPGHHTQNVKTATADLPRTAKAMGFNGRATPLSEGIAHRAEEQLIDLYDDPLFPVFVRYRRLHTATHIKADLMLHHFRAARCGSGTVVHAHARLQP